MLLKNKTKLFRSNSALGNYETDKVNVTAGMLA